VMSQDIVHICLASSFICQVVLKFISAGMTPFLRPRSSESRLWANNRWQDESPWVLFLLSSVDSGR